MKHCKSCHVDIETNRMTCPLCLDNLEEVVSSKPHITEYYQGYEEKPKKLHLLRKIFLFLSLVTIGICVTVNILTYNESLWSLIVIGSILYLWVLIKGTIMSRRNIALRLWIQAIALGILLYFIQLQNNQVQWVVPYAIPFIMIATMMAITLLIFIKTMRYRDYMMYLILVATIGCIPIILTWIKKTRFLFIVQDRFVTWPSICCFGYAIITILGMFIFGDRATKDEFKKRFHI